MSQRHAREIEYYEIDKIEKEEEYYMHAVLFKYYSVFEKLKIIQSPDYQYDSVHQNLPEFFWWDVLKECCSATDGIKPNITVNKFFATDNIVTGKNGMKKTLHMEFSPFHDLSSNNALTANAQSRTNMHLWIMSGSEDGKTRSAKNDNTIQYNHFGHELQEVVIEALIEG